MCVLKQYNICILYLTAHGIMAKAERRTMVGLTFQLWPQIYMADTIQNGLAPFQQNGHDAQVPGHEVSNGLQQNNLLMEEVLKGEEHNAPTAKMDSPEAGTDQPNEKAEKKTKRTYASSITNTLTHCAMFIAAGKNLGRGYATQHARYELTNLELVHTTGVALVDAVAEKESRYKYGVAYRKDIFGPLEVKLTRILAEVILSGASPNTVEQVRSLIRKLRGTRAVAKNPDVPAEDYHSVSQRNHDDIVANFAKLILMVLADPNFNPTADDIKEAALQATLDEMRSANTEVIDTKAELDAGRNDRNNFFNAKDTGLVDVFLTAKKVVVANFGTKSEEYKRVKGLSFRRIS